MNIPPSLQQLINQELEKLERDHDYSLSPYTRLIIYDAIGPTFAAANYIERIGRITEGHLELTQADRVRAWLAIITAERVLPIWDAKLAEVGEFDLEVLDVGLWLAIRRKVPQPTNETLIKTLQAKPTNIELLRGQIQDLLDHIISNQNRQTLLDLVDLYEIELNVTETERATAGFERLYQNATAWQWDIYDIPTRYFPRHLLKMAQEVLEQKLNPDDLKKVLREDCEAHEILGRYFGRDEEEFSSQAHFVGLASYEALSQAIGLGPFNGLEIKSTTVDEELHYDSAAATMAVLAYAGIFRNNLFTRLSNQNKKQTFWRWWLEEAIPAAFEAVKSDDSDTKIKQPFKTVPFKDTTKATFFRVDENSLVSHPNIREQI